MPGAPAAIGVIGVAGSIGFVVRGCVRALIAAQSVCGASGPSHATENEQIAATPSREQR